MTPSREECLHGNSTNCYECAKTLLVQIQRLWQDPDAPHLMPASVLSLLKRNMPYALERIADVEREEGMLHTQDDVAFFSPRNDPSAERERLQLPRVVAASAFGAAAPHRPLTQRVPSPPRNALPVSPLSDRMSISPGGARMSTSPAPRNPSPRRTTIPVEEVERVASMASRLSGPRVARLWSEAQLQDLKDGYDRFGAQWETIRKNYPALEKFSGMQLKDKHRASLGSRKK